MIVDALFVYIPANEFPSVTVIPACIGDVHSARRQLPVIFGTSVRRDVTDRSLMFTYCWCNNSVNLYYCDAHLVVNKGEILTWLDIFMQNMTYSVNIFVGRSGRCSSMHVYKGKNKQSVSYRTDQICWIQHMWSKRSAFMPKNKNECSTVTINVKFWTSTINSLGINVWQWALRSNLNIYDQNVRHSCPRMNMNAQTSTLTLKIGH